MSYIWILHGVHGLGGWLLPFLQFVNDLRDSDLLQEPHARLVKIRRMTQQVASFILSFTSSAL